jgi:hypothetical protein
MYKVARSSVISDGRPNPIGIEIFSTTPCIMKNTIHIYIERLAFACIVSMQSID